MKSKWSPTWKNSVQPRKQRKYAYNAPMHVRQKLVHVHLSKELRKKLGTRTMQIRKGDEVKVMHGGKKGIKAKVADVSLKLLKVYLEGQTREKTQGRKVPIPFEPSNLMITELKMEDKRRGKNLRRISKPSLAKPKTEPKEGK